MVEIEYWKDLGVASCLSRSKNLEICEKKRKIYFLFSARTVIDPKTPQNLRLKIESSQIPIQISSKNPPEQIQ